MARREAIRVGDLFHTSYESLAPEQFLQLIQLKDIRDKEERPEHRAFVSTSMLRVVCKNLKRFPDIRQDQLIDCFDILNFIDEPYTGFIVKSFRHAGKVYAAPARNLDDATFYQVVESDAEFTRYLVTQEEKDLDKFCLKLYRPVDDPGSPAGELDSVAAHTIFYNYAACRNHFTGIAENLFPPPDNDTDKKETDRNNIFTGPMWLDLLYSLADTPAFQGIDKAKTANFYEALLYLDKRAKDNREMKERLDEMRTKQRGKRPT